MQFQEVATGDVVENFAAFYESYVLKSRTASKEMRDVSKVFVGSGECTRFIISPASVGGAAQG